MKVKVEKAQEAFFGFVAKCIYFEMKYPSAIVVGLIASGLLFAAWIESWK